MSKKEGKNIDKSKIAISITIFIICFIIVYVMCVQFKTVSRIDAAEIETLRENELREALAEWKEKYKEVSQELEVNRNKIAEYRTRIESNQEAGELLEAELERAKMLLGVTDVKGTGVTITLSDNAEKDIISTVLMDLVNELNYAGAEAISINDQRIVAMTDIVDVENLILVNKERISSPYTVKAIGDLTYLQSALSIKKGYLDKYQSQGYTISMVANNEVLISKYNGHITLDYVK